MAENVERSRGRPSNYKFDRGGSPTEFGPFVGEVTNNVDPTRSGRLQVWIEQFAGEDKTNKDLWRTVSYCPPFGGSTPRGPASGSTGTGQYPGNQSSYGMWFTPPDLGVKVLCFFVGGDPKQGYYVGCIPDQGLNHMVPAIGATDKYVAGNKNQETYFAQSQLLPVTEINNAPSNTAISENPKFFDQPKPVHAYAAAVLFQQGLNNDPVRGSIGSSAQRESPSSCYGISTPGRAIYDGGMTEQNIQQQVTAGTLKAGSATVIGRRGGHTFVMDDGDLTGTNNLIRIRSSKGHQITMSDDGNCFYICHANGQTWVELGQEGTLDVFSTNSINLRTQGTINLHADQDVNIYAGNQLNLKSKKELTIQSDDALSVACKKAMTLFSETSLGLKSNTTMALKSKLTTIDGGSALSLKAILINLNGGPALPVTAPKGLTKYVMPDTTFNNSTGWQVSPTGIESIVTRAPTHEPWPYHNQGVANKVDLQKGQTTASPAAPTVPAGVTITKTGSGGNAAQIANLQSLLDQEQKNLASDLATKAKIVAGGTDRPAAAANLAGINQVIADREKIIAQYQQQIASLKP